MLLGGRADAILHILCSAADSAIAGEIAVGHFRRLRQEPNPYFFACLLKICNGPKIALPIRSACELRM
jgi:hypothetical protein